MMLVSVFRKIRWYTPVLFVLIALLLWFDALLTPGKTIDYTSGAAGPLYELIRPLLIQYQLIAIISALIIVIFQALAINHVATSKSFTERYSLLPAILYLLLMSSTTVMIAPHPVLFANIFLIPALRKMFDAYDEEHYMKEIFNIGFLIAIAGMFYYPALTLFLAMIIAVFMYYIVNLRTLMAACIGLLTPIMFLSIFFFLQDTLPDWLEEFRIVVQPFLVFQLEPDIYQKAFIALLSLLSFFAFFRLQVIYKSSKPIRIRKRITILLLFFVISVGSFLFATYHFEVHYGIINISLSIALAVFFYDHRNHKLSEILFGILLLLVLASRYASYFMF